MEHKLKEMIKECDLAIQREDFDRLMDYYTDDAILVVKPGKIAHGKEESQKSIYRYSKIFQ